MDLHPSALVSAAQFDTRGFSTNFVSTVLPRTIVKKLTPTDPRLLSLLDRVAIEKFLVCNSACLSTELSIEPRLKQHLIKVFYDLTWKDSTSFRFDDHALIENLRHGPGGSVGTRHTSHAGKEYLSTYTFTSSYVLALCKMARLESPSSFFAEDYRQDQFGCKRVTGSKTSCVPKDDKASRLICTEPLLNMEAQLAAGRVMEGFLKSYFNIDLSRQPDINRNFAKIGSINGAFSTIDLKSASDTISLEFCRQIMPPILFELLLQLRSPSTKIGEEVVELQMMSTMGNGFTFPLQTIVFAAIASFTNDQARAGKGWSVFGDDIIVQTKHFAHTCESLSSCGFTVNSDKSFSEGFFRESCGGDYYLGQDVRGVYIKRLETTQDCFVAYNILLAWSLKHEIPLVACLKLIFELIPKEDLCYIPYWENDNSGLKGFLAPSYYTSNQIRWYNYKALVGRQRVLTYKRYMRLGGTCTGWLQSMCCGSDSRAIMVRDTKPQVMVVPRRSNVWDPPLSNRDITLLRYISLAVTS